MKFLADKTVVLTGASRGLGIYIARALAREQATIIGVSLSNAGLDKTYSEVTALGGKFIGLTFDLKKVEELPMLVQQINKLVGSVDILINNYGIELYRSFADYSLDDLQSVLVTNLLSAIELTRLLLPSMLERDSGHIVNIASLSGKKGVPYNSIYSATKASLNIWTDALQQELASTGMNISVICPGYISEPRMTIYSHILTPRLAGISRPSAVAKAVISAIKKNKAGVIVNESMFTEHLTKLMFTFGQLYPQFLEAVYQWFDVVILKQRRVKNFIKNRLMASLDLD